MIRASSLLLAFLVLFGSAYTAELRAQKPSAAKASLKATVPFYGNQVCPVCQNAIDKTLFAEKKGERIYVCKKAAIAVVTADWDAHYARAYPKEKLISAGNVKCPMMPRKRGKKRFAVTFQGYTIPVCCKKCKRNFPKQPRKWLTLALNTKVSNLKNTTCLVMKDKAVKSDSFVIFGDHLIATCGDDCLKTINKNPAKFSKTLKAHLKPATKPAPAKPSDQKKDVKTGKKPKAS